MKFLVAAAMAHGVRSVTMALLAGVAARHRFPGRIVATHLVLALGLCREFLVDLRGESG